MKKIKKLISAIVASATLVSAIAPIGTMSASAYEEAICIRGLNGMYCHLLYTTNNNTVTITGCFETDTHITIPAYINGKKVVAIQKNAFSVAQKNLRSVVVGPNVERIGENAFGTSWLSDGVIIDNRNVKLDGYYNGKFPSGKVSLNTGTKKGFTYPSDFKEGYDNNQWVMKFQRGDIDNDGYITVVDAQLALDYAVQSTCQNAVWDHEKIARADVNRDGDVGSDDAELILQYYCNSLVGSTSSFEQFLQNQNY